MTAEFLFYGLIGIIVINYVVDVVLDTLNASYYNKPVPKELADIYDEADYQKSQAYKRANYQFSMITSTLSVVITLTFFLLDGFRIVDTIARSISSQTLVIPLLFFGIIMFASELINLPLSFYRTFVIEERFGFNKSTIKTFVLDKIKGWVLSAILGGGLLVLIHYVYLMFQNSFWLLAWGIITVLMLFMNLFYAKLIVPVFNKQTPLEEGTLQQAIQHYATKVGFALQNIFVIDGSKRSSKANAYFSGFGNQKRITLFDTLIHDLNTEEIVSVLAHEVGHYKKKHILYNLLMSVVLTGLTLYIFSLCIDAPILSEALHISIPSFHIGLIAFGILYTPISAITGYLMGLLSRRFEYQADQYAKETYDANSLISALKKLTKNSLSNLTPHPLYVALRYSHPTLLQRLKKLEV